MFNKNIDKQKVINIDADMEGTLKFSNPVTLKINGKFSGDLEAIGTLVIGEKAEVKAKTIKGESINIFGKVKGDIICSKRLELSPPAEVVGDIKAAQLIVKEGVMLKGNCYVPLEEETIESKASSKKKK